MIYKRKGLAVSIDNVRESWEASGLKELDIGAAEKVFAAQLAGYKELLQVAELFRRVEELRSLLARLTTLEQDVQQAEAEGAEFNAQLAASLETAKIAITAAAKELSVIIADKAVAVKELDGLTAELAQQRAAARDALQKDLQSQQALIIADLAETQLEQRIELAALQDAVAIENERLSQIKAAIAKYTEVK